jgi:hypothetical protein
VDTRLSVEIETSTGRTYRWDAGAEDSRDRPVSPPSFDTARGTGFGAARVALRRRIDRDYPDLGLGSTIRFLGADGTPAYEGWMTGLPRSTDGGHAFNIDAAGFMALGSDEQFTEIYGTSDVSRWQEMPNSRRADHYAGNRRVTGSQRAYHDAGGEPTVECALTRIANPSAGRDRCEEPWWDSGGIDIGRVEYDVDLSNATGADWVNQMFLMTDPTTVGDTGTNHTADATGQTLTAGDEGRTQILIATYFDNTLAATDGQWSSAWKPRVYGRHDLTEHDGGFYVSDLIRDTAARWAPQLNTDGVQDTSYPLTEVAFFQPTFPFDAWQDWNRYHLYELAVWEDKRLVYEPPASLDEWDWEVRSDDPGVRLSLEGDQFPFNGVSVTFTDLLSGRERTIGPDDYAELYDSNQANPATAFGRRRFLPVTVPFPCVEADAVQVGRAYFAEAIRAQARGSIRTGSTVRDRAGNEHPAWKVRAGERIVITDLPNDRPRRITTTGWDGRSLTVATDNISRRMEAIFDARMGRGRAAAGLG